MCKLVNPRRRVSEMSCLLNRGKSYYRSSDLQYFKKVSTQIKN